MKVGFDGRYAEGKLAGIGKYIKYLAKGLAELGVESVIFYSRKPETEIRHHGIDTVILKSSNRYIFEQILLPRALTKYKVDLYHAAGNAGVPLISQVPAVMTIHDIIPLELSGYFGFSKIPPLSKASYILRTLTSCAKAKRIITISNFVKKELITRLGKTAGKITVINSGISLGKGSAKLPAGLAKGKYILNHGGIDIRKNLDKLIAAFALVHRDFGDLKLVITGENPVLLPKLKKQVKSLNLEKFIIFSGYVEDNTLWTLIKSSACICYPTLMEGFGAPVLEGFAAGVPAISSRTTSIPEIAGEAALLINPKKEEEIAEAIRKVLTDAGLTSLLVERGLLEAKKYNWQKTAKETLEVYKEVLA